jgi:hypothetical protein
MDGMEGNVGVTCTRCETFVVVMPAEVYKAIGDALGPESEIDFSAHVATGDPATGRRLAIADVNRVYACPVCGKRGALPPPEEQQTD